jgi:hypothetical protein
MKDGDFRISVECLRAGQPRPYADTFHAYRVTIEWIPYDTRIKPENKKFELVHWNNDIAEKYCRAIYNWNDDNKWPGPRLNYFKQISQGIWEFEVIDDFTD